MTISSRTRAIRTAGLSQTRLFIRGLAVALSMAALCAGCGSTTSSSSGSAAANPGSGSQTTRGHGSVNILYAGSLENVMNNSVGPAFEKATGYSFAGFPAGSKDLASEIKGKVRRGDVFISASPKVNKSLEGSANGGWVSWFAPFGSSALVIGYNPSGTFATALKTGPWYRVIARNGFRIGYTDPKLDPKGVLAVAALRQAAATYNEPALKRVASSQSDLFPEQDLVGRLQSGQLDAGFFYTVEASAAHIPTVSLGAVHEKAKYTITVLHGAPNQPGAVAFVRFLLGPQGQALLRRVGLDVTSKPAATGTGVPVGLTPVIQASR